MASQVFRELDPVDAAQARIAELRPEHAEQVGLRHQR
jgi:hypothetical protein